jgi:murein DD-endopeptidase MepM/ murein hydrolase activator NlpD
MHYGIDLKVQTGDTIYAAFDGKVRLCQYERRGYGYYVVLRHSNGLETVYGHLSRFLVSEDDVVKSGDPVALGGSTGRSTGSHLHFEFRFLGKPINPNYIVDFDNKVCHRDEYMVSPSSFENVYTNTSSGSYTRSGKTNKYVSGSVAYHRVQQGDSLFKIARVYGTTVSKICRLNNLTEKSKLQKGQVLRVS